MKIDWNQFARNMSGLGAGLTGRGAEWQRYQDRTAAEQQALAQNQRQQMVQNVAALNREFMVHLDKGNFDQAYRVAQRGRDLAARAGMDDIAQNWNELLTKGFGGGNGAPQVEWMRGIAEAGDVNFVSRGILEPMGGGRQGDPADLVTFNRLLAIATDPNETPERRRAAEIKLRLKPGAVGSADMTAAADPEIGDQVTDFKAGVAGATEQAKQDVQLVTAPAIREAVATAESRAKAAAEQAALDKSNGSTFLVYEAAMTGLAQALDDTLTGPFVGMIPAITSNQQIANGAVAAMAPVLKQLFRAAGEGQFTDKDQELLLDMVPTRTDKPEARVAKMQNIDAIVRAKLGQTLGSSDMNSYEQWKRERGLD